MKLIQQVDDATCTSACLAMLLDKPIMEVISDFHFKYARYQMTPIEYLESLGVNFRVLRPFEVPDNIGEDFKSHYLVTVPSLNSTGTLHHVVIEFNNNKVAMVLDPNKGRSNMRYYTFDELEANNNPDAYILRNYILEIEFDLN